MAQLFNLCFDHFYLIMRTRIYISWTFLILRMYFHEHSCKTCKIISIVFMYMFNVTFMLHFFTKLYEQFFTFYEFFRKMLTYFWNDRHNVWHFCVCKLHDNDMPLGCIRGGRKRPNGQRAAQACNSKSTYNTRCMAALGDKTRTLLKKLIWLGVRFFTCTNWQGFSYSM